MDPLASIRQQCLQCRDCPLCETRTNVVFGVGDPTSELMFIGEGPGQQEDLKGEPFVGAAGQLLDDMLELIDLDRSRVYIANTVKCRPPNNRIPTPEEAERTLAAGGMNPDRAALLARLTAGDVDLARRLDAEKEYWSLRERVKKALLMLDGPAAAAPAARILKDDREKAPDILESVARDAMRYGDMPGSVCNGDMADVIERYSPLGQTFLEGVMTLKMRLASNVAWTNALECLFMEISGGNTVWQP